MSFDNTLKDMMSSVVMDFQMREVPADNNTLMLVALEYALAGLVKACLTATDDFQHPENIHISGLVMGLTEMLEWILDNTIIPEEGINHG